MKTAKEWAREIPSHCLAEQCTSDGEIEIEALFEAAMAETRARVEQLEDAHPAPLQRRYSRGRGLR